MVRITCPWFSQARGENWLHRSHRYPGSSASCHEEITVPMEVVLRPLQIPTPRSPGHCPRGPSRYSLVVCAGQPGYGPHLT